MGFSVSLLVVVLAFYVLIIFGLVSGTFFSVRYGIKEEEKGKKSPFDIG